MIKKGLFFSLSLLLVLALAIFSGCKKDLKAKCDLINTEGENIGTVIFTESDEGVKLSVDIKKMAPGSHAFHIFEKGNFTPPDFKNAGGHYNPFKKEHGLENPKGPHAGDFKNIEVDENGTCKTEYTTKLITLKERMVHTLFRKEGTSIIIHEKPDDYKSDPAGNAGPRIAGGIIKKM